MAGSSASEVVFISVNYNITLIGKIWFILMIFLRALILLLAGYPLYQDEQERFVCNTIQPGCANVCYDLFSPISLFRFWLVQIITLCIPYIVFIIYVVHKVSNGLSVVLNTGGKSAQVFKELLTKMSAKKRGDGGVRFFAAAYILHLMFRTLLEVGFGAAHYYLFGFYIPRRFLCQHPPCTTQVDCYISRPTEKTVMLNFMLGVAALSLLLNVLDFFCAIKRSVLGKSRHKVMVEDIYEEAPAMDRGCSVNLATDSGHAGGFRRRRGSKGSCGVGASDPACGNTNGNNGCSQVDDGSEVALCPPEPTGTPRSIRVSKRSRLKPPPPPRRDLGLQHSGVPAQVGSNSSLVSGRAVLEDASAEQQTGDEGPEKRSQWV
ncbi:gap junction delta-4 protein [Neosynchiropus ocellatus]